MKERPILFSAPMVRAILAGTKTQMRRILKPTAWDSVEPHPKYANEWQPWKNGEAYHSLECPYGIRGDRLWVRETFLGGKDPADIVWYRATEPERVHASVRWTPSIHMRRRSSRILLEVTGVRVERLQLISEEDARAEGIVLAPQTVVCACQGAAEDPGPHRDDCEWRDPDVDPEDLHRHQAEYAILWNAINGKRAPWSSNPWVWVVEFRRLEPRAVAA